MLKSYITCVLEPICCCYTPFLRVCASSKTASWFYVSPVYVHVYTDAPGGCFLVKEEAKCFGTASPERISQRQSLGRPLGVELLQPVLQLLALLSELLITAIPKYAYVASSLPQGVQLARPVIVQLLHGASEGPLGGRRQTLT